MEKVKRYGNLKSNNILEHPTELPLFIYAKVFGDTFIMLILSLGLSICIFGGVGIKNGIYYLYYCINDISFNRYFIIVMLVTMVTLYAIISWICILSKRKYIKITKEEIMYKSVFKIKVIYIEKVQYVNFDYTDNGIFKANRTGMLIKCDSNVSKYSSNDLFINYIEFPKEQTKNAINSVLKFEK